MGGVDEGTKTTMEMVSIVIEVVAKSTQVALDTIEVAIKTMHPSTMFTIVETKYLKPLAGG